MHASIKSILLVFLITFILCVLQSSCAPMPGNTLFPELDHPTALDQIEEYEIIIDPLKTSIECNKRAWKSSPHQVILNCIGNGCFVFGCASVWWDSNGDIYKCSIYASFDFDWVIEHEKRHCMGYSDVLY